MMANKSFEDLLNECFQQLDDVLKLNGILMKQSPKAEILEAHNQAIQAAKDAPMGVSEWRKLGKQYGYWEYFEKVIRLDELNLECQRLGGMPLYIKDRVSEINKGNQ